MQRGSRIHIDTAAFHEAGHAVAALWEGRTVHRANIRRDQPGDGRVLVSHVRDPSPFDPSVGPGSARAAWQQTLASRTAEIRILLAGPVAEAKALGQPLRSLGVRSNFEKCHRIVGTLEACWVQLAGLTRLPPLDPVHLLDGGA